MVCVTLGYGKYSSQNNKKCVFRISRKSGNPSFYKRKLALAFITKENTNKKQVKNEKSTKIKRHDMFTLQGLYS